MTKRTTNLTSYNTSAVTMDKTRNPFLVRVQLRQLSNYWAKCPTLSFTERASLNYATARSLCQNLQPRRESTSLACRTWSLFRNAGRNLLLTQNGTAPARLSIYVCLHVHIGQRYGHNIKRTDMFDLSNDMRPLLAKKRASCLILLRH